MIYFSNRTRTIALAVLAGFIYLFMVVDTVLEGREDFLLGWHQGYNHGEIDGEIFFLDLQAKGSVTSFFDTLLLSDGVQLAARYRGVKVLVPEMALDRSSYRYYSIVNVFLAIVAVLAVIVLPFLMYRVLHNVYKGEMFCGQTVSRIRLIGAILIVYYLANFIWEYNYYMIHKMVFDPMHYSIVMGESNLIYLMLGVVVLLLAEVTSVAIRMKEELDLTV
ncbi:DUF2975 domain-containing protein [Alkaliflexus imshenetskii]|uniref:DUF2975 domain-containing protein n=1 Tax=Alkaliflexus imshenetskii TaxID=286730 RepID=UPI00047E5ED8|nr:DUF2975 domain-containing protein [Alkaliflexus imshenetskii]